MRLIWTFFAGMLLAVIALVVTAPIVAGVGLVAWATRGDLWTVLSGPTYFAVRDDHGRLAGRSVNIAFHPMAVLVPGDPRPQRLLIRLEVATTEFAAATGDGRVRLDVWPVESVGDLRKAPLYTVVVPGRSANLDPEGMMLVERGNGRRSAYALGDGAWLYDADVPVASFVIDAEHRRYAALAQADDDMPLGAVAVLSFASPQRVIRRLLISADDAARGRFLRGSVAMTRPVARLEDAKRRVLEVPLPAGILRMAFVGDDLDLATAEIPAGLKLTELKPWRAKGN